MRRSSFLALLAVPLALTSCGGATDSTPASAHSSATSPASDSSSTSTISHAAANPAFRPLSPASTARVTQHTPTFRWVLPAGVDSVTLDLCLDRACTRPLGAPIVVSGDSYTPANELPAGVVYWRVHSGADASVVTATWELWVGAENAAVSTAWGTTLDVNGDGYADLPAGSFGMVTYDGTKGTETNASFVYLGGPGGVASSPATTVTGPSGLSVFGTHVQSAGDVNGDGYADLIVSGWVDDTTVGSEVYLGGEGGLSTTPVTSIPTDAVVFAGDVDGDGYSDLLGLSEDRTLSARVYFGSAAGPSATSGATLTIPVTVEDGDSTTLDIVTAAGDVNGDGYADVVACGAIGLIDPNASYCYLYPGGALGLATQALTTLLFDSDVIAGGDLDGDGFADLLLVDSTPVMLTGTAKGISVYRGGTGGFATTPVTSIGGVVEPVGTGSWGDAVALLGDTDGDGRDDFVVTDGNATAYVYKGSAGGAEATPAVLSLVGVQGFSGGASSSPGLGDEGSWHGIGGAGDLNGDGYADLAMSASLANPVLVYLGSASGLGAMPATTLANPSNTGLLGSSLGGGRW